MGNTYKVQVLHFSNILEIEGARTTRDFEALLDAMEYGDLSGLSDAEKREMCILSLQDREPEEAAYLVLKHDMADVLRDGQMRNAAGEMQDEKLWEEYSNSTLHERFFNAGSLLYAAFPKSFPKPDAVRLELQITAAGAGAKQLLKNVDNESFLVRLLADGMDDHAILHRLYGDQLSGKSFPNAAEIVWTVRAEPAGEDTVKLEVISSGYWLDALERTKNYESAAYPDAA
ncbi:hypothetical protein [uncultured Nisaea sp.]|uniref:hypothetical protein n=1 Tax=uncultured Nisaea sp. TaxID=538215 RepID=UPI0030EED0AD|tara:strand:- start:556 stop:1245 length:690 start_codon:yes stop_codon:yes gene_type:complete